MPEFASLRRGAVVPGTLDLAGRQDLVRLPENLVVHGTLDVRDTQVGNLPETLVVGENLFLTGTPIRTIPDGACIGKSVHALSGTLRDFPAEVRTKYGIRLVCDAPRNPGYPL